MKKIKEMFKFRTILALGVFFMLIGLASADTLAPTITFATPSEGMSVVEGSSVLANYSCADSESGVKTCTGNVTSGSPIDTTVGPKTFTIYAEDNDGNNKTESVSYTVSVAPTIDPMPDKLGVEATSSSGAVVTWDVNSYVHDGTGTCSPESGSTFALGNTTVTCSVTGRPDISTTFKVEVVDITAPVISAHGNENKNSAVPLVVTYTSPNSVDIVDGTNVASCTPASGSVFPIGTTAVTCTATDSHGNVAIPTTFDVIVTNTLGTHKGKVIITFDDGLKNTFDVAYPILNSRGQKAVAFVYPEVIIYADAYRDAGFYTDFMKTSELGILLNGGWDISSHSYTHCCENVQNFLVTANNSALFHELIESKSWIRNVLPLSRSNMFFAYPYGVYTSPLPTYIKTTGYLAARTVESSPVYQDYVIGSDNSMKMTTIMVDVPTVTSDNVKQQINSAVLSDSLLIITFHTVTEVPTGGMYEYSIGEFTNVSDYLYQLTLNNNVQITTFSEYFGIPTTINAYTPPTPITPNANTSSRNDINFSWVDDISTGVVTDVFDVVVNNGTTTTTTYFTTNKFIVVQVQPGQKVDASVWAVNQSYGTRTLSLLPLTISATMPSYMPSTPIGIASTMGSNWIKTNWTADNTVNKTDLFDINVITPLSSTWKNGTTDTSINTTGLSPGQSITVKVYALNGTIGATTKNIIPAELTTTLPITNSPVIISAVQNSADFSMTWTYNAGLNTTGVEIGITKRFENGTVEVVPVELIPLPTDSIRETKLTNLLPHTAVNFSIRGYNSATTLYSAKVYVNMSLENNPIGFNNIDADYSAAPGSVFKLQPVLTNIDGDEVVFSKDDTTNDTSINSTTGEFVFNTVNATIGRYSFNIKADDKHGSVITANFKVFVANNVLTLNIIGVENNSVNKNDLSIRLTSEYPDIQYILTKENRVVNRIVKPFNVNLVTGKFVKNGLDANGVQTTNGINYAIVDWLGSYYIAVNGKSYKLAQGILEQGVDESKVLNNGDIWNMGAGWTLSVSEIDNVNKTARLILSQDGFEKMNKVSQVSDVYTYTYTNLAGENDVPVFTTYIDNITSGQVTLKYTWLISIAVTEIKIGDKFGDVEIVGVSPEKLTTKGNYIMEEGLYKDTISATEEGKYTLKASTPYISKTYYFTLDKTPVDTVRGSSGGSSGGSGGGGVASVEDVDNIVRFEKRDGTISVGKDITLSFTTLGQGIYQVILSGESQDVTVRIDNLKHHQKDVTEAPGKTLLYSNVMISSSRIKGFSFNFKLNKTDITNTENVKAYVWENNTWKALDTNAINSDASYVYFGASSTPAKLTKLAFVEIETSNSEETTAKIELAKINGDNEGDGGEDIPNSTPGFEVVSVAIVFAVLYLRRKN